MAKYWGDGVKSPREPLPDDADYDHERVINDIKKVSFKFKKYKIENFNTHKWGLRSVWLRNLVPSFHPVQIVADEQALPEGRNGAGALNGCFL